MSSQQSSIKIPYQQSQDKNFNLFQTQLATALQPITSIPTCKSTLLTGQQLNAGANTIQTSLGYPLSGWYIVRQRAQAAIWDTQDSNPSPNTTLILNSSASVSVDIIVF